MSKYRALELSFIGNRLVQPGEVVDYDGEASGNLEKLSAKEAAKAEAVATDADAQTA